MTARAINLSFIDSASLPAALGPAEEMELIARLLADEPAAWREFNQRYSRLMLACITRVSARIAYRGIDDVQEIYATLCLQLLNDDKHKLRKFEPNRGTRLGTFLHILASHCAHDFYRANRHKAATTDLTDLPIPCDDPSPVESALLRERGRLLANALATLSEKDREFMDLYFGQGLDSHEIAERLGIQLKTVYTRKHKLQLRLQSLLLDNELAA